MAAPNKDGWAVNFIYEQDLRSQYMNQMFLEMLQPGVYNPQLYLKPNNPAGGSTNLSAYWSRDYLHLQKWNQ